MSIDEDRRDRRVDTIEARAGAAVDALLAKAPHDPIADRVLSARSAERAREGDFAAEARNGDGGIGGIASADGNELARLRLGVGQRKLADPEYLVENGDPRAQDVRHVRRRPGRLPPRRG
jgi:hypothetical protein